MSKNRKIVLLIVLVLMVIFRAEGNEHFFPHSRSNNSAFLLGDTLDAPDIRCLSVKDSNRIQVFWLPVNDPNASFHCYVLYQSLNASSNYSVVDTIWNRLATSEEHHSPQAQPGSFYYVSTVSEVSPQTFVEMPGDTFQSLELTAVSPGPNTGLASLGWNEFFYNKQPTNVPYYKIYKKISPGNWTFIDSTHGLNYVDTISVCQADISYQIRLQDSSICVTQSNIDGGTFEDKTPPNTPQTDSVSVLGNGIHIHWNENSVEDTWGYIIFKKVNNLWTPLDTLFGKKNTHYIDSLSNGCSSINVYNILAFDSCWNTSPSGKDHQNIRLSVNYSVCQIKVELNWNDYINLRPSLDGYQIFKSINGGSYQIIKINSPGNTAFTDTSLTDSTEYCYFIRAKNTAGTRTSSSCKICIFHKTPPAPGHIYLSTATVIAGNENILVRGIVDTANYVKTIRLYRSTQPSSGYKLLTMIPFGGTRQFSYEDKTAKSDSLIYYYQAVATDSCGNESVSSNVVNNILLSGDNIQYMKNRLQWNEFIGWQGLPAKYDIHRRIVPENQYKEISTDNFFNSGIYTDDVSGSHASSGDFYYYVTAKENDGNIYGLKDSSASNRVLIRQESRIYVPNAFTPGGLNPVFRPYNVYVDTKDYRFIIYDRWGRRLFTSKNPDQGWDGDVNGKRAPTGTYLYQLRFKKKNGNIFEKKGTVTLLR
ncbi:MAG: gliding motility-associated C-terminal domain-containing protein [Bacteroidales bacterium]|nr:gliding motility-associated C-terminal domain-containing protein [Bacteroidales bacterium]